MKKLLLSFLTVISLSSLSWAGTYNITASWEMDAPVDLAGYNLRINSDNETMISIPAGVLSWSGELDLSEANNVFELQAIDLGGQVSGWSDPASFDPPPHRPRLHFMVVE